MTPPPPVTVVLADDHPMFREGLRFTLAQAADVVVVGEAADGQAALDLVEQHRPDIVMMDLGMPGLDGLGATRLLVERGLPTRVLVLTMYDDDANVLAALEAGALGYLLKGAGPDQILSAVRAVADGHAVLGAGMASRILLSQDEGRRAVQARKPGRQPDSALASLSVRETEVLEHLARGRSNQEIARTLFISPITVRNHVSAILTKLQVSNRREAMLRAVAEKPSEQP